MNRRFETGPAPHLPPAATVGGVMRQVIYALVPGIAAHCWFFGPGILIQIAIATVFAVGFEAGMLRLRRQPLAMFLADGSAVVTAILFALCIPPLTPWWVAGTGMLFAIVIAKHLYGGLGYNIFNPAMIGYAVVLICFPAELTRWLPPENLAAMPLGPLDSVQAIVLGVLPAGLGWDTLTQATPLDAIRTGVAAGQTVSEIRELPVFGDFGGRGWEWIANWYAVGGLWLIWRRIISWHVPVAMIGTVAVLGLVAFLTDPGRNPSPLQHVFSGALVLGAFFIATDPVSGCASNRGRLIFGAGAGILTLVIRRWGGYPDGVAFAVLLMNMAAPIIDRYTRPRFYGE